MSLQIFQERTREEHRSNLAKYLLDGLLMKAKNDNRTNMYKLLFAFAETFRLLDEQINLTGVETFPEYTVSTLERWEKDFGIPDDVFDISGDLEERRNNLLIKIAALGVQTEQDFIDLGALFGVSPIEIEQGGDILFFPLTFPIPFGGTPAEARNVIFFHFPSDLSIGNNTFPLSFPIEFSTIQIGQLEALFLKLIQANQKAFFIYDL